MLFVKSFGKNDQKIWANGAGVWPPYPPLGYVPVFIDHQPLDSEIGKTATTSIQWNLTINTTYGGSQNGLNIEVVSIVNQYFFKTNIFHAKMGEIQYLKNTLFD